MKKDEVLQVLDSNKNAWLNQDSSYKMFKGSDISVSDNGLMIGDLPVSNKAIPRLVYRMGLNEKFMDYPKEQKVDSTAFVSTLKNIVNWNNQSNVVAQVDDSLITNVFPCNLPHFFNGNEMLGTIYDDVRSRVEAMSDTKTIEKFSIDTKSKNMKIAIVNPDSKFSMMQDDEWVLGSLLSIGLTQAQYSPYYGRLVCLNGMVDGVKMRSGNISSKNYSESEMRSFIRRAFKMNTSLDDHILNVGKASISTQASLKEYLDFRETLEGMIGNGYGSIKALNHVFGMSDIHKAYGDEVETKSNTWKKSAICGLSVYELLNDITNFTTHSNMISSDDATRLNKQASKWFLTMNWDNYDVAPIVRFKKNPAFENSSVF